MGDQPLQNGEAMPPSGVVASLTTSTPTPTATPTPASVSAPPQQKLDGGKGEAIQRKQDTPATSTFAAARPPYVPQFSAATQMILNRMRMEHSKPSFLSSFSASGISAGTDIKSSAYNDAKRRLVMGMATSTPTTLQMPAPAPPTASTTSVSSTAKLTSALQSSTTATSMAPSKGASGSLSASQRISQSKSAARKAGAGQPKIVSAESKVKKTKIMLTKRNSNKRKRGREERNDSGDSSSLSELSDVEPVQDESANVPPTMTKSGRQVTKPATYDPAAMDAGTKKRVHYGKRTQEQALCKRCTRMHSPTSNQMVFCDDCDDAWHQLCHEPRIDNAVVRDTKAQWFCAGCQGRRDRLQGKKPKPVDKTPAEDWQQKSMDQKRAYLSGLSHQDLLLAMMRGLEVNPDLPIYPAVAPATQAAAPLLSGPINSVRKAAQPGRLYPAKRRGNGKNRKILPRNNSDDGAENAEENPFEPKWTEAGKGMYSLLPPEREDDKHLVDHDDYESFSVILFDERGRKIEENGLEV